MKFPNGIIFLRITMGVAMMLHGIMKLIGGPSFWEKLGGMPPLVPEIPTVEMVLGFLAMAIELVGGLFVAIGYKVRLSAFAIVGVMVVAFIYHAQSINSFGSFVRNSWPLEIGLVFLSIAFIHSSRTEKT